MRKEIFFLEDSRCTALFAPLQGLIMEISPEEKRLVAQLLSDPEASTADVLALFPEIDTTQLLESELGSTPSPTKEGFRPDSAVLFTTFDCNLKCIYCYARAGERKIDMTWETAKATIDFIIANAKASGSQESSLKFHGGGEPTWNWDVFRRALNYFLEQAKNNDITPEVGLATNGILSEDQVEWIAQRMNTVQVSMDGTREIHNFQRPYNEENSSNDSFDTVCQSISSFLAKGVAVTIHCVITSKGMESIPEISEFFVNNFPRASLHFEPVCECGRGMELAQEFSSQSLFTEGFSAAEQIAGSAGSEIFYSGTGFDIMELRENFCGVSVPNFTVTPEGFVTACHEVAELTHPLSPHFIYGRLDSQNGQFAFDHDKIKRLQHWGKELSARCSNCFAQYHCGGECLSKKLQATNEARESLIGERCRINKELLRRRIFTRLLT